ncbi:MAG: hypothetical protein J6C23_06095 [Clostridia bacterium]|nr:hypothetical protein [Clostridia bacterium]
MNKKVKALVGSVLAIAMSMSVAAAGTFALFTDKAEVNVAITAGKVDVEAEVSDLKLYSMDRYLGDGVEVFENLGSAKLDTASNTLTLTNITPGDKVEFDLSVVNKSNVAIKYRSVLEIKSITGKNLMDVLKINLGAQDAIIDASATRKVSKWTALSPDAANQTIVELIPVSIELPVEVGNDYQNAGIELSYYIEAIQGNAETVDPSEDVIEIASVSDLKAFASSVNAGNTYADKSVVLTENLDLADEAWTAIGATGSFKGIFDGKGHSISGLKAEGDGLVGLFGTLNGTVKNLTVIAPELDGASAGTGAIAGKIFNTGLIDNCTVIDPVIVGEHYAGGIVGYAYGNVTNCTVEGGSIDITTGAPEDGDKVGGIVGYVGEGSYRITGNTAKNITLNGVRDIGGIAGMAQGGITVSDNVVDGVVLTAKNTPTNKAVNVNHVVGRVAAKTVVKDNTVENQQIINIVLGEGTFVIDNILTSNKTGIVITGAGDATVINAVKSSYKAIASYVGDITFKDLTMELSSANYQGFQHAGVMNYENVTFNGSFFLYGEQENFVDCSFNLTSNYVWTYGAKEVNFVGCDFNTAGKAILVYNEAAGFSTEVNVEDCNFAASASAYAYGGIHVSAVSIDSSLSTAGHYTVNFTGVNNVDKEFNGLVQVKKHSNNNYTITGADTAKNVNYSASKEELKADLSQDVENIVINLVADQVIDVTAWETEKFGGDSTKTITINGNGYTIDFYNKDSDWNNVAAGSAKLIINNAHITNSGYNNGPWNRHDINFACDVELNNVTSDKALAFKAGATLNDVTINDANTSDTYAIWIQPNGQTINIDGLTIDMIDCSDGRGIKIDEQYVSTPQKVTLNIKNATFKTEEKSAIIVKSVAGADITLENVDISGVAADSTNAVWVDEASEAYADLVVVTGASKIVEP